MCACGGREQDEKDADNEDDEPRDILREFVDMSVDRDIMKEFVNESLERENNIKKAENEAVNQNNNGAISKEAMKQDLVECLDLIERSVSGKIIDANNDNEKHSNKESGEDMDHENDSTNVSITLQDSSSDKKNIFCPAVSNGVAPSVSRASTSALRCIRS